ncbi:aminoglycoside phosphotransferase [Bacillus sp. TS-2]|nr:aminoglycoside phosphotransferase [Bacillus sp. TS-2]
MMITVLKEEIALIRNCESILEIKKGYSNDQKYLLNYANKKQRFILRTFQKEELAKKRAEFTILKGMEQLDVSCPRPLEIGESNGIGYMIVTYLEGDDGENSIFDCSEEEQYHIGQEAGKELLKIHQYLNPSSHSTSWFSRKSQKHQAYLEAYLTCGMKVKHEKKILEFIEEHIHLMKDRPTVLQHDDYHLSNIVLKNKQFAGILDFGRFDWGDPYHEFLKIGIFSSRLSIPFSIGQIEGYFKHKQPNEHFWKLYSLYLAMSVFSSIVWCLENVPNEIDDMMEKITTFLEDHDYFDEITPHWYQS